MVVAEVKLATQSLPVAYSMFKDMFSYFNKKEKYFRDLYQNFTDLTDKITNISSRLEQFDRNLKTNISKEKSSRYDTFQEKVKVFKAEYQIFSTKCGLYKISENDSIVTSKFFKRAKLSKKIKELHDRISVCYNETNQDDLLCEKEPEQVQGWDVDIDIPSFSGYVDRVVKHLAEEDTRSIGLLGPIGVGKTTVMEMLNNKLKTSKIVNHDIVIWIDHPKDNVVEMMQDTIIGRLKLVLGEENKISKRDIISKALCDKKYILLIDQVSSPIDLREVGISKGHKFGKVVVASSSNKYITQLTDKSVQIEPLSDVDAFSLFEEIYGKIRDERNVYLAERIIESCGRLPLVIKLVAGYLKGRNAEEEWSDVKRMLQSAGNDELLNLGGVGNAYKLVYDGLGQCYMKKCLLFGALFPNGYKINKDYLVECWMAEGFLESSSDSDTRELRKARDRGATVLRELTDRCLLEGCCWDKYVKMHVYFRKVALQQTYPYWGNCKTWVPKLPNDEFWSETTRMSLIGCNPELPEIPNGGKMSTLLLQRNRNLRIGERFFDEMQNLRVLDLYKTDITSLPSSVSSLINLVSLYLNDCCKIDNLSLAEKLSRKLQVLDIRGSSICELRIDMPNLRCLRVSLGRNECYRNSKGKQVKKMMTIPSDIIISLKQLEELVIETGCCNQDWNEIVDQITDELASLEMLTTLCIHFPSVHILQRFVTNSKSWTNDFRSFRFSVGCCEKQNPYVSNVSGLLAQRQLRLFPDEEIGKEISPLNNEICLVDEETSRPVDQVLKQSSAFELVGQSRVAILSREFDLIKAGSLKVCTVGRCKSMTCIVDDTKAALFKCLEMLHLYDLDSLESIWKGKVFSESLARLKVITLSDCPKLTEILNCELAIVLSSLEHLKVENCSEIRDIITIETSQSTVHADLSDTLPKLETIELVELPNLENICASTSKKWKSLRKMVIIRCGKLRKLHFSEMKKVERIECEYSWWNALELGSVEVKKQFVGNCDFVTIEGALTNCEGESSSSSVQTHHNNGSSAIYDCVNGSTNTIPDNQDSTSLPGASKIDLNGPSTSEERCRKGKVKIEESGLQAVAI